MTTGNLSRPALILLSGLPGSGKTTFAHQLAARFAVDHFESDAIRFEIAGSPTYAPGESARVFRTIERRVAESLNAGHVAIVDATNLTQRDRKRFVRLARALDVPLVAVLVLAPDDTVRERLSSPREGYSEATTAIYDQMKSRVQPFPVPSVIVDTRFPLEPTLTLVERLLETS